MKRGLSSDMSSQKRLCPDTSTICYNMYENTAIKEWSGALNFVYTFGDTQNKPEPFSFRYELPQYLGNGSSNNLDDQVSLRVQSVAGWTFDLEGPTMALTRGLEMLPIISETLTQFCN